MYVNLYTYKCTYVCALPNMFQLHHSIVQINLTLDLYSSVVKLHRELRKNKVCYGAVASTLIKIHNTKIMCVTNCPRGQVAPECNYCYNCCKMPFFRR